MGRAPVSMKIALNMMACARAAMDRKRVAGSFPGLIVAYAWLYLWFLPVPMPCAQVAMARALLSMKIAHNVCAGARISMSKK